MPQMNRNDFSGNPVRLDMARSSFNLNHKHKTTFKAGLLIPILSYGDVLPGDTLAIDMASLVRMATPVFPVMDDCYLDVYAFFTPHKLTLSRQMMSPTVSDGPHSWKAFIGAQDSLLNMPAPSDVLLPYVISGGPVGTAGAAPAQLGSLTDYLGIGLGGYDFCVSCLEPLAYYAIWNSYFRDENTMNPVTYSLSSASTSLDPNRTGRCAVVFGGFDGTNRWGSSASDNFHIGYASSILPVCRPHGYFGSALPWPQRNLTSINLPLSSSSAPLVASTVSNPVRGTWLNSGTGTFNVGDNLVSGVAVGPGSVSNTSVTISGETVVPAIAQSGVSNLASYLSADLSNVAAVTVNQLRFLVQEQRWFEALARGGNRIGEITASMFGVTPSDLAQDRPEYLGGKRIPINMDQVAQTAPTSGQPLGTLGAFSSTGDQSFLFEKSFDTWGTVTVVACVRTNESFHQGLPRRYNRKGRFDFYWPQFANLGEQPVLKKELLGTANWNTPGQNAREDVFGYQEAWAEYRYLPDIVSGELRPDQSLGAFTYCNHFQGFPTLPGYIDGTGVALNIDRTLQVASSTSGFQFIGDFAFKIRATRPMPRYSIPGLVDHH